ncbi:alpha/beta hydrolase [Secundilactobacillus collinoides]|nr:alpha/beta fold hydrolase [Secundilactobacillus collinoides]KZL41516.1 carboxylesterase [Secundilactobacillus collinoides]
MIQMPKPFFFENDGPKAIVLMHAYASSSNDVRMLGRHLQSEGYTVLASMFTGHATGEPKDILTQGSPAAWWQDTLAAIQQLRDKGYQQISIFGLSLGGIFAMKALETDPDLIGGGSFSSPVVRSRGSNLVPEFIKLAAATYKYTDLTQDEINADLDWLRANVPAQLAQVNTFAQTVTDDLPAIHKAVFVAQGGEDELIDANCAYDLKKALTNAQVDFHYYEHAGHVITVNSARHELMADLDTYLTTIYN